MARRLGDACSRGSWANQQRIAGSGFMYKASKRYLTLSVSALVVAILFSLAAILVRSVVAPEMDGKIAADGTALELRKSLP
jgi:hypothetical protein